LAVAVVAAACFPATPPPPPPPPPTPTPPPPGSKLYLTFDDGPSGVYTQQILSVLQAKGVPATFFLVGQNAARHPGIVQQEHAAGKGIGNHSWDHQDLTTLPTPQVRTELQSTSDEIAGLTGVTPTLWRPPFGAFNATVTQIASSLGLSMRLWDVNPEDYTLPGVDTIVSRVVNAVTPDDIILMHDGSPGDDEDRSQTVAALPIIIDTLRSLGYSFGSLVTTAGASSAPTGPTGPDVPIGRE
jgi:peptidoglycan/xylan/chitin deacetylase (PgdA/CDA1 family)